MASTLAATRVETDVSSNVYPLGEAVLGPLTSPEPHKEVNYKGTLPIPRSTEPTAADVRKVIGSPQARSSPTQGQLPLDRVQGVVDQVEGDFSKATIFYSGRENKLLFPTARLSSAGAAYPGAIFEVIMEKDGEYWESKIVHRADEEEKFRNKLAPIDLSFLDEI